MSAADALRAPPYFDGLIEAHRRGEFGRFVHLGYWDDATPAADFERAQRRLDDLHRTLAQLSDGQAVLDVGCGFGGTLEAIDRQHAGMSLTGLNADRRQLAICRGVRESQHNALTWVQADACALPFADGRFDRVLCIEAMFHFRSRRVFLGEAARVLKPGGVLVCSDIVLLATEGATIPAPVRAGALRQGYGPWPDPWAAEGSHAELAAGRGLECDGMWDFTAQTERSHRFTAPALADPRARILDAATPSAERAALVLGWLHRHAGLRYSCFRFVKCARSGGP